MSRLNTTDTLPAPSALPSGVHGIPTNQDGQGLSVAVVVSQFNAAITEHLKTDTIQTLIAQGVSPEKITVCSVPGAFELPLAAKQLAKTGQYQAIITLGCVIRGETSHYELVCEEAARGVAKVAFKTGVPVIFGVLTTNTVRQAHARAGLLPEAETVERKGHDCALAAIEMARLLLAI